MQTEQPTENHPSGAELLDRVRGTLTRYVVLPSDEATEAVVLWIAATHAQPSWAHARRLVIRALEKRCGKSRLLDIGEEDPPTILAKRGHGEGSIYWDQRRQRRENGDTKTRKSRRRLAMPMRCAAALHSHRTKVATELGDKATGPDALVFPSTAGTELDLHNLRRQFRNVVKAAGSDPKKWTLREMRHTFVSLLSDDGMPLEDIARLVGHQGTAVTELVYRHQLRPVLEDGATAMDRIFGDTAATGDEDQGQEDTPAA